MNPEARRRGTYFDFALVYPNPRVNATTHYASRDIGTTVTGQKGPDDTKTLRQTTFTVGDYLVSSLRCAHKVLKYLGGLC